MVDNRNQLAKPSIKDILNKLNQIQLVDESYKPFGDGHASIKIVQAMETGWRINNEIRAYWLRSYCSKSY